MRLGIDGEASGFVQQIDRKHQALAAMTSHEPLLSLHGYPTSLRGRSGLAFTLESHRPTLLGFLH